MLKRSFESPSPPCDLAPGENHRELGPRAAVFGPLRVGALNSLKEARQGGDGCRHPPLRGRFTAGVLLAAALAVVGCEPRTTVPYQGYLEGEFVYVASPLGGQLEKLSVQKGAQVVAGTPLFTLERSAERAAQREAEDRFRAAQAKHDDLKKGSRPTELAALVARLEQARAAAELSKRERDRQRFLFENQAIPPADLDRAVLTYDQNAAAVADLEAQVATAQLGARSDAITAAEAEVAAAAAAKERADWAVNQKVQSADRPALVHDTLYREGEFVPAGRPVVALLPPENIKVRFFVSETDLSAFKAGDRVRVAITGAPEREARVTYLSSQPEYTPPVLYNRDNRAKLVFMIEAAFGGGDARSLHPGQPVDVLRAEP